MREKPKTYPPGVDIKGHECKKLTTEVQRWSDSILLGSTLLGSLCWKQQNGRIILTNNHTNNSIMQYSGAWSNRIIPSMHTGRAGDRYWCQLRFFFSVEHTADSLLSFITFFYESTLPCTQSGDVWDRFGSAPTRCKDVKIPGCQQSTTVGTSREPSRNTFSRFCGACRESAAVVYRCSTPEIGVALVGCAHVSWNCMRLCFEKTFLLSRFRWFFFLSPKSSSTYVK